MVARFGAVVDGACPPGSAARALGPAAQLVRHQRGEGVRHGDLVGVGAQMLRLALLDLLQLDLFGALVGFVFGTLAGFEDVVDVVALALFGGESPLVLLSSGELFVADHGVVFQRDGQVAEERAEGVIEHVLVTSGQKKDDDHDDSLDFAGSAGWMAGIKVNAFDEEEEADKTQLHHIQAGEKLVDGRGKEEATSVKTETRYVEGIVSVDKPEERKSDDVEDQDQG